MVQRDEIVRGVCMTRDTRNEKGNLQDAKKGCAVYQLKGEGL